MKLSVRLLTTHSVAGLALLALAPMADANSGYGAYYPEPGPERGYGQSAPVATVVPDVNGKVYLEATYDPALGAYVYPQRIEVQSGPYQAPIPYRAKRIYYEGYTPVIPDPSR